MIILWFVVQKYYNRDLIKIVENRCHLPINEIEQQSHIYVRITNSTQSFMQIN